MYAQGKWFAVGPITLALIIVTANFAAADAWLTVTPTGEAGLKDIVAAVSPELSAQDFGPSGLRVTVDLAGLTVGALKTQFGEFVSVTVPDGSLAGEIGAPAIPVVRRLFIAPPSASVTVDVQVGPAYDADSTTVGARLRLTPVQPPIPKTPGARENAPFVFDAAAYSVGGDYAPQRATVTELGLVRGQRLMLLEIWPVRFNPGAEQMTFWTQIVANVRFAGGAPDDSGLSPLPGLWRIVLNPSLVPAPTGRGSGNYLILVAQALEADIAGFATAKTGQGFTVTTHTVAAGTTNTQIKTYIQSLWGNPATAPDYILIVGDTNLIPHWVGQGSGSPDTDLYYACMDGANDWYPDIAIGRFPARTGTHVNTLVGKTLYYENGPLADPAYLKRAAFMASNDNYTVSEGTHNYCIDTHMTPHEYLSDKLYCHTYNATTQQVRDAFNNGRFYGIYSGHGSTDSWADGPPFSQADVNGLTNADKYAFVCSFACLTGQFSLTECFMETWVLAPNKAALADMGSSVTSYWTEDDILQRVMFDAIFDNDDSVLTEAGPIINEAKLRYLAHFGPGGSTQRYFEMYNELGDPALPLPSTCSDAGTIQLDSAKYACSDMALLRVADCGLNLDNNVVETVTVTIASASEPAGENVVLSETSASSATFEGTINVSSTNAPGVLWVAAGDTVTATYIDANDGQGHQNVVVTATAVVDCTPPTISNVQATDIEPHSVTIAFTGNEPVRGTVHYGLSCDSLNQTAVGSGYATAATVGLSGLQDNTTYYFVVEAEDEAGNTAADPNCYSFATPEVPDYFTELFTGNNDLHYLSLLFVPNGSVDFYAGCTEPITQLPTDPAGGTPLSFTPNGDDGYAQVNLSGGATVKLYGVSYNLFYVGTNGYITFGSSDTEYDESLALHFAKPRAAGLFDDLTPSQGGMVSWKQLSDRVAVTWLNVTEYNASNQNTLQIELFFDGRIGISYLGIAATDGLAGLSEGQGLSPDYYPSDLSALGSCGPRPPSADNVSVTTAVNTPVLITLPASDDGLPDPPGALTYIVTSLPAPGVLEDFVGGGQITSVPYTLLNDGNVVRYKPQPYYAGPDSFQFKANDGGTPPDGGDSNTATAAITVGGPQRIYNFPLDTDPGWTTQGQWAFGVPAGSGGDPSSGHTGSNVYGYNLNGQYPNNMPRYYLTTTAINCSEATDVTLKFWRWLGVESATYDHAGIEVSNNGTSWVSAWEHGGGTVIDTSWSQYSYDISAIADHQATVYLRWAMGTTDISVTYCGWNIDDIEIWGVVPVPPLLGDLNCDGVLNAFDIDPFVLALTDPAGYETAYPDCNRMLADCNNDGVVNAFDIDPFVGLLTGP